MFTKYKVVWLDADFGILDITTIEADDLRDAMHHARLAAPEGAEQVDIELLTE